VYLYLYPNKSYVVKADVWLLHTTVTALHFHTLVLIHSYLKWGGAAASLVHFRLKAVASAVAVDCRLVNLDVVRELDHFQ
jgi:hypothetical protein